MDASDGSGRASLVWVGPCAVPLVFDVEREFMRTWHWLSDALLTEAVDNDVVSGVDVEE